MFMDPLEANGVRKTPSEVFPNQEPEIGKLSAEFSTAMAEIQEKALTFL